MPANLLQSLTATPTPAPSPTDQTAFPQVNQQIRSFTDRIPGIDSLPPDIRPIFINGLDLILLALFFLISRKVVTGLVLKWTNRLADKEQAAGLFGRAARLRTLSGLVTSVVVVMVGFVFAVSALSIVGVNVAALVGTVSVVGLAIGFGAQKLAKDVITGFIILTEDQYGVGEYVTINSVTGTVEDLSMRTTRIRDDDGKLYILSNGDIGQVCNQSRGPVAGSFEIPLGSGVDTVKATDVLDQALAKESEDLSLVQAAHVAGITLADANRTVVKISFRAAGNVRPGPLNLRLRNAARAALIAAEIPLGAAP